MVISHARYMVQRKGTNELHYFNALNKISNMSKVIVRWLDKPTVCVYRAPHLLRPQALQVRPVRLHARRRASTAPCKRLPLSCRRPHGRFDPVNGYILPMTSYIDRIEFLRLMIILKILANAACLFTPFLMQSNECEDLLMNPMRQRTASITPVLPVQTGLGPSRIIAHDKERQFDNRDKSGDYTLVTT
jgi:hypothetical protein